LTRAAPRGDAALPKAVTEPPLGRSADAFASLAEVYGRGAYAPFTREMRLAGADRAALVRFSQPAGDFPDPPTPDVTLALNERGAGRMRFDIGAGRREVPFRAGDLVLKPAGVATRFAMDAPHQKSFVSLPAPLLARLAAEAGGAGGAPDFGRLHAAAFRAPRVARLLQLMWSEPATDSPHARLFNDGAILALVGLLIGLAAPRGDPARGPAPLSASRLARLEAFVEAHLAESFGVEEMAAQVGLSAWHFCRAFRQATGQTPRAFVTARRIARARRLLEAEALPLAAVAQACGFADQAHFTTVFGRHTGRTPGAYRRGAA